MNKFPQFTIEHIKAIKQRYETELMRQPNVVGVGIGLVEEKETGQAGPGIVITVKETVPLSALPTELDGAPVQVLTVGTLRGLGA